MNSYTTLTRSSEPRYLSSRGHQVARFAKVRAPEVDNWLAWVALYPLSLPHLSIQYSSKYRLRISIFYALFIYQNVHSFSKIFIHGITFAFFPVNFLINTLSDIFSVLPQSFFCYICYWGLFFHYLKNSFEKIGCCFRKLLSLGFHLYRFFQKVISKLFLSIFILVYFYSFIFLGKLNSSRMISFLQNRFYIFVTWSIFQFFVKLYKLHLFWNNKLLIALIFI